MSNIMVIMHTFHIFIVNFDVVVPIRTIVLVVKPDSVQKLVNDVVFCHARSFSGCVLQIDDIFTGPW